MQDQRLSNRAGPLHECACNKAWNHLDAPVEDEQLQGMSCPFSTYGNECIFNPCIDSQRTIGITRLLKTTHLININISTFSRPVGPSSCMRHCPHRKPFRVLAIGTMWVWAGGLSLLGL